MSTTQSPPLFASSNSIAHHLHPHDNQYSHHFYQHDYQFPSISSATIQYSVIFIREHNTVFLYNEEVLFVALTLAPSSLCCTFLLQDGFTEGPAKVNNFCLFIFLRVEVGGRRRLGGIFFISSPKGEREKRSTIVVSSSRW